LNLGPMTADELRETVEQPAACHGVSLQPGLTEQLLAEVATEPGRLPLLEFTLTELWARQYRRQLTHAAYPALGGVSQALAPLAPVGRGEPGAPHPRRCRLAPPPPPVGGQAPGSFFATPPTGGKPPPIPAAAPAGLSCPPMPSRSWLGWRTSGSWSLAITRQ